jgi:hypothetical protein
MCTVFYYMNIITKLHNGFKEFRLKLLPKSELYATVPILKNNSH